MNIVRGFALKISQSVVRWASPVFKEWALGLAREVEFIPSDWRALAWAVGSMRVLLEPREEPLQSLEAVPGVAHRFVDSIRSGTNIWYVLFQAPIFMQNFFGHRTPLHRFGSAVFVFGAAFGGINILRERRRLKEPWRDDVYDDVGACTLFYRGELERQLGRVWIPPFVLLCYAVGMALCDADGLLDPFLYVIGLPLCGLIVAVYFYLRRLNVRRIERLDALLAERQ